MKKKRIPKNICEQHSEMLMKLIRIGEMLRTAKITHVKKQEWIFSREDLAEYEAFLI